MSEAEVKTESQDAAASKDHDVAQQETEARARGWKPKDEYTGKGNWKEAADYLRDGDEISALRRELTETKNAFIDYGRQNREAAYAQARKELEAKLDDAVEAGDKPAARAAAAEIKKVDAQQSPEMPAPAKSFVDRNKGWFGFHDRATDYARMMERRLFAEGVSVDDVYSRIESSVRDRFPELSENPQRERPSAVDTGVRTTQRKKGHGLHITDLPEQFQKIARDYVKRGVITEEKYIQSLLDDGTIRET